MTRIFFGTALIVAAIFVGLIGLIRLQPYDDGKVRGFLALLGECSPPCWQGVRPGETTTTSAVILLEAHPWVNRVNEHIWFSTPGSSLFSWSWNGQQPPWIESEHPGVLVTHLNRIRTIKILTRIPLGDLWLSLPNMRREVRINQVAGAAGSYIVHYPARGFEAHIPLPCPFRAGVFWQSNAELYFVNEADILEPEDNQTICRDT